jgi:hypothetical protein
MRTTFDGKMYSEWFDGEIDIEVQMSRHRFVYAGVPSEAAKWAEIRADYAAIKAKREAVSAEAEAIKEAGWNKYLAAGWTDQSW